MKLKPENRPYIVVLIIAIIAIVLFTTILLSERKQLMDREDKEIKRWKTIEQSH